ncbi:MAG TPA: XdhC/CoxI family protein [Aggregatilineales bacterium]|nr:XdhC/CoxI family protein [Aggregatilineales bacterium]
MQDILATVEGWLKRGDRVALATVVSTWGSSPRPAGAKLAVTPDMAMIGSVSGGCVESAVIQEALDSLSDGVPRLLHFGVGDDTAWEVGLTCGGTIDVLVEPLDTGWWAQSAALVSAQRAFVTVTVIAPLKGAKLLISAEGIVLYASPDLPESFRRAVVQAARGAAQSHRGQIALDQTYDVLIDVFKPQPRLVMVGGSHVGMAMARIARILGWHIALVEPRQAFATRARFPDVDEISHAYPDKALPELGIDSNSYVVVLTHDPKIDDPALRVVLPSDVPYVGILSSKRAHQIRVERLSKAGLPPALLEGIHVPVGIDIGASTPEEIALCIMAEMIAVRHGVRPRRKVVMT